MDLRLFDLLRGSGYEHSFGIAVDSAGNAYVTGGTCSTDFPTINALKPYYQGICDPGYYGGDAYITKIDSKGVPFYSTYLGGSRDDEGTDIAVDSAGNTYLTGNTGSSDFPIVNAYY